MSKKNGNDVTMLERIKLGAKKRIRQAWNWTKDHPAEIVLGALAVGGGAYLLNRGGKDDENGDAAVTPEPINYDAEAIDARIQDAWNNECEPTSDPYGGPTED